MRRILLALSLVLLVLLAGCLPRTEPGQGVDIGFSKFGTLERTEGEFVMEGNLTVGGGTGKLEEYHGVTIYLYSEEGQQISKREVGVLRGHQFASIKSAREPHYVIIDSPDFWRESVITVRYYVWSAKYDKYGVEDATARGDFPVDLPADISEADAEQ